MATGIVVYKQYSLQRIAEAIGYPATFRDSDKNLAQIIDDVQMELATLCRSRGCTVPEHPTFPELREAINTMYRLQKICDAIGAPATASDDDQRLAQIIDEVQMELAALCRSRGCTVPEHPTFPELREAVNTMYRLQKICDAIGAPATASDDDQRLAQIIDGAQTDLATLCNEKGCGIPAHPTFSQITGAVKLMYRMNRIADAIGSPASVSNNDQQLAQMIDSAQIDIAALCNERGCSIPAHPTFSQIISGISSLTHFTKPQQVTGLKSVGAHDAAGIIDLSWSKPTNTQNYSGVRVVYKTGSYPTSPSDGSLAYDGTGTSKQLTGVSHGTTYYFRAFAYNLISGTYVYNTQESGAKCTGASSLNASSQVSSLRTAVGHTTSGYVKVTWTNPSDSRFKGVQVMYKTGGYPASPTDGTVLYTGTGTSVEKTGLTNGTTYYFRAFAYNLSNGIYAYNTTATGAQATGIPYINKGKVVFTSSRTWTVPAGVTSLDVFLVGGGASGGDSAETGGGGGGGGYTRTVKNIAVTAGSAASVIIGSGGAPVVGNTTSEYSSQRSPVGKAGSASSFAVNGTTYSVAGGKSTSSGTNGAKAYYKGTDGGSGGGQPGQRYWNNFDLSATVGGSNGSDGVWAKHPNGWTTIANGVGQKSTTREFGESSGALYAGGGGGAGAGSAVGIAGGDNGSAGAAGGSGGGGKGASGHLNTASGAQGGVGTPNTGGGGGGGCFNPYNKKTGYGSGAGGSGVVVVRWGY